MSAFGTPTIVNGGGRGVNTVTSSTFNTSIGDFIAFFVGWSSGGTVSSFSDVAGNTYVARPAFVGGGGQAGQWYYCSAATHASAVNAVTANFSSPGQNNVILIAYDSVIASGVISFDVDASGNGSTGAVNTTGTDELGIGVGYNQSGGNFSADAGYTLDSANFQTFGGAEHILYSAPQTGVDLSMGQSGGVNLQAIFFKAGAAPPPTKPTRSTRSK
jgi:hypothetical protein